MKGGLKPVGKKSPSWQILYTLPEAESGTMTLPSARLPRSDRTLTGPGYLFAQRPASS